MVDVEKIIMYLEKEQEMVKELLAAMTTQMQSEPGHMERMRLFEVEAGGEDDMSLDEGKLAATMQAHKTNSPFALDVSASLDKLIKGMEG